MLVPLSWLKKYIDIEDLTIEELSDKLTMAGLEVELIEEYTPPFSGIYTAEVISTKPHPEAEKLKIATVSDGIEEYQVVCGAPNCRKGLRTAFAKAGEGLIKGSNGEKDLKIKKGKLHGIESFGMLCSGAELQISEEHDGILELPEDLPLGEDFANSFKETILEIGLTPNLGHCFSMIGVARELGAILKRKIYTAQYDVIENNEKIEDNAKAIIEDYQACPRYTCRLIKNIQVAPSPKWLREKLSHAGINSVNNIVDATNYVMLEYGHPLHAFDYNKLNNQTIIIRKADEGNIFQTLDGQEHKLSASDLLICDGEKAIAIAGIMGGKNSEVDNSSHDILIESAYFDPSTIRRTSKSLGLSTESSKRFERGTDPNNVPVALERITSLIQELAGGKVLAGIIDIKERAFTETMVSCRLSRINKILGTQLGVSEVQSIFESLDFKIDWDGKDTFKLFIPTYRNDISMEIELIEEVARIYGYNNIKTEKVFFETSSVASSPIYLFEKKVRSSLLSEGLQEFIACDLISPEQAQINIDNGTRKEEIVTILNPTSQEQSVLRSSLLPGSLQILKHNIAHGTHSIAGFEIGRIHFKSDGYHESSMAALTLSGRLAPLNWDSDNRAFDFYDIKGIIENLFANLNISEPIFKASNFNNYHPLRQATISTEGIEVGVIGEVNDKVANKFDINQRTYFAEINIHTLFKMQKTIPQMKPIPTFPGSTRDWTITLPFSVEANEIIQIVKATPSKLLKDVYVKDIFVGDKIGEGLKNMTFHFYYRDDRKTISQKGVEKDHARIISQVEKKLALQKN